MRASVAALHVTGRRYWAALGRGCALLPRAPRPSPAVGVASASAVGPEAVRSFHNAMDGTQAPSSGSPSSGGGGTKTSGAEAGKREEQLEQKGETKKPEQPGWYELIDPGIADIPGLLDVVFGANPRAAEPSSVRLGGQAALQLHATPAESDDGVVADGTDALDQESDPDMFDFASDLIVAGVDSLTSTVKLTGDAANAAIVTSGTLAKFAAELAGNTATALIPQLGQVCRPRPCTHTRARLVAPPVPVTTTLSPCSGGAQQVPVSPVVRTGVAAASSVVGAAKHVVDSGVGVATGAGGTAGRLVGSAVRGTVTYVSPTPTSGAGQRAKRTPAAAIGDFATTTASVASTTVDTTVSTLDSVVTGTREAAVRVLAHTVGSEVRYPGPCMYV